MQRDTVEAVVSFSALFQRSYCGKVNVPLDENGDVAHFDAEGSPIAVGAALGGEVAAVYDLTGLDYLDLRITQDGVTFRNTPITPGMRVQLFQGAGYGDDPDVGEFIVRRVVTALPTASATEEVTMLLLDRAFSAPMPEQDVTGELDRFAYRIDGPAVFQDFHIGGKVDVIVDTVSDEERVVVVSALDEVSPGAGVYEIPLVIADPGTDSGTPLFESGKAFLSPVLEVLAVDLLGTTGETVERELVLGTDWRVIRASARSRFTATSADVVRLVDPTDLSLLGGRIRVTYLTNADIGAINDLLRSTTHKNQIADVTVTSVRVAQLDVVLEYSGELSEEDAATVVSEFIYKSGVSGTVKAYDIMSALALFGVTDITGNQVTLAASILKDNGTIDTLQSNDRLTAPVGFKFRPVISLSITKKDE
jgi:hypothetical protein